MQTMKQQTHSSHGSLLPGGSIYFQIHKLLQKQTANRKAAKPFSAGVHLIHDDPERIPVLRRK